MKKRCFFSFAAVALTIVLALPTTVFATTFKDVPASHYAYAAINRVTDKGFMLGDLQSNFNPDAYIDKFEALRTFAKLAGYKLTGATAAEKDFVTKANAAWKTYISQYSSKFKLWNTAYNEEISYLLEKKILMPEDLNQIVILIDSGEAVRQLNREEACLFFARVMGKQGDALAYKITGKLFSDDASISSSLRPYVYYLQSVGVVSGSGGAFSPSSRITRAAFAYMVNAVYLKMNPSEAVTPTPTPTPSATPAATASPAPSSAPSGAFDTVSGTISTLYPQLRAIHITSADTKYNNKIYILSTNAIITVDSLNKTYADLKAGMQFTGVISNSELISVSAATGALPSASPGATGTPATTAPPVSTPQPGVTASVYATIVSKRTEAGINYITVQTRVLSPKDEIIATDTTYQLAAGCSVTSDGAPMLYASINTGDIVTLSVSGLFAYSVDVEIKNRSFSGILTDKHFEAATGQPYLTVTTDKGAVYKLKVTATSLISRKGQGETSWNEVRVGDNVDVRSEYNNLKELYAYGTIVTVDITIKDIYISKGSAKITGTDSEGVDKVYPIILDGTVNPYTLVVGSRVRLRLDSSEIMSAVILETPKTVSVTGTVTNVTRSTFTIRDTSVTYPSYIEVRFDAATKCLDSEAGRAVLPSTVGMGMQVVVVLADSSNYATSITIAKK